MKVLVVLGSTRLGRLCPQIAEWVMAAAPTRHGLALEVVDLLDWHLPMDDEPGIPARDGYTKPHTQAWSGKVAEARAFVFVSPQYNWGYPAPLKNALDHLYAEWRDKPALIVTYGYHGGEKCAAQLRQVLEGLHMRPVTPMPALTLTSEMFAEPSRLADPQEAFAPERPSLEAAFDALASAMR